MFCRARGFAFGRVARCFREFRMSKTTRATEMLDRSGASYSLHSYDYDPSADRIGIQAASALDVPAGHVLKTLMLLADNKPACAILPSDCELSMKKLAHALGAKSAQMMKLADAERITGFKVGGISPFDQNAMFRRCWKSGLSLSRAFSSTAASADFRSSSTPNRSSWFLAPRRRR